MSPPLPIVLPMHGPFAVCHGFAWPVGFCVCAPGPRESAICAFYCSPAVTAHCFKILHYRTFKIFLLAYQAVFIYLFSPISGDLTQGTLQEIFDSLGNLHWPREVGQKEIKPCLKSNRPMRPNKDEKTRPKGGSDLWKLVSKTSKENFFFDKISFCLLFSNFVINS